MWVQTYIRLYQAHICYIGDYQRKARRNVSVVWLDLANAYGAVLHPLIRKALRAFPVNQSIIKMILII